MKVVVIAVLGILAFAVPAFAIQSLPQQPVLPGGTTTTTPDRNKPKPNPPKQVQSAPAGTQSGQQHPHPKKRACGPTDDTKCPVSD